MGQRVSSDQVLDKPKVGDRPSLSDAFVQLKPADDGSETTRIIRLIGWPFRFKEHTSYKRNPDDPKKPIKVDFPDAATNKAYNRVCTENDPRYGACKYCELGYKLTTKFSQRCLERYKDENGEWQFAVKIFSKGPTIFDEFAKFEKGNREINADNGDDDLCTFLGGEVSHDIRIKSKKDASALGGVSHTVTVVPNKKSVLSEEEIEAIYARYKPTAEDLSRLINLDLYTEGEPEWYVGGFKLHEIHKPAKSPTASAAVADSTTDELTVNEDENDDEPTPAPAPAKPAKATAASAKPAKPAKAEAVVEEDEDELDPFSNSEFDADKMPF